MFSLQRVTLIRLYSMNQYWQAFFLIMLFWRNPLQCNAQYLLDFIIVNLLSPHARKIYCFSSWVRITVNSLRSEILIDTIYWVVGDMYIRETCFWGAKYRYKVQNAAKTSMNNFFQNFPAIKPISGCIKQQAKHTAFKSERRTYS